MIFFLFNISFSNTFFYKIIIVLLLFLQNSIYIKKYNILKSDDDLSRESPKLKIINDFSYIYNDLYHFFRPPNTEIHATNHDKKVFSNKCERLLLCAVGKNENLYAKEFVEFYHTLGFDKIIIFDNNDLDGEKFDDILKNYLADKIVEIIDIRGLKSVQLSVYNYCYKKNKNLYDWIAFFYFD